MSSVNIISVTPYPSGTAVTNLPAETAFKLHLRDISAVGAGRNQAYKMNKKRVGQEIDAELEYTNLTNAETSTLLSAFNPEYVTIVYRDPKAGSNQTKVFYISDRDIDAGQLATHWKTITFGFIQQSIDLVQSVNSVEVK